MTRIGERIKQLRVEKGVTQDRLSIMAGVDQSGLSKLERGAKRSFGLGAATKIARALNVSIEELVRATDYEHLATSERKRSTNSA